MGARVLIIDDEPRWIQFAQDDLASGFEIDIAIDLEETLTKLKTAHETGEPYALIIASSRQADILEVISKNYPGKPIIVATGQPTTREAIDMYRLGAQDYFAKDLRGEIVSAKIRETMEKLQNPDDVIFSEN